MTTETTIDTGIVGRIHDAVNRGDLNGISAELTEDVVFHEVAGEKGLAPKLSGRDAVMEFFETQLQLREETGTRMQIRHQNARELGGYLVALGTASFELDGETREFQIIDVCRVRDGKLAERWAMHDDDEKVGRFLDEMRRKTR